MGLGARKPENLKNRENREKINLSVFNKYCVIYVYMEEEYIELEPNNFEDDCTGVIKTFIEDNKIDVFKKNDGKYEKYTGELRKQVGMSNYNFSPNLFVKKDDLEKIKNDYEKCKQKVEEARRKMEEAKKAEEARLKENQKWHDDQRNSKLERILKEAEEARQRTNEAEEARLKENQKWYDYQIISKRERILKARKEEEDKNWFNRFKNFFKSNKVAASSGGRKKTRKSKKQRKNKSRRVKR
jgi:hypothetical protein